MSKSLNYYGFTIKCIKKDYFASLDELIMIKDSMLKCHRGTEIMCTIEKDSLFRLHLHGTFVGRKNLLVTKFRYPYYTIHIDPLDSETDLEIWSEYIMKDQEVTIQREQKAIGEQIRSEYYPFIDMN